MHATGCVSIAVLFTILSFPSPAQDATEAPFVNAVMNAASYGADSVAPGEMVVIFGTGLGPYDLVNLRVGPDGKLVSDLEGVRVLAGSISCPLLYVSRYQVAAVIPYGVSGAQRTRIQVEVAGVRSNTFEMPVALSAPGVFTVDSSGAGPAAIQNSDGTLNSSSTPAKRGDWITFYLTGEGRIAPAGVDGFIIAGTSAVVLPVKVTIAGYDAEVLYAGSAPGNVNGFAQVNVIVPPDLPFGGDLPLSVQIGDGLSRPDVTVAVEGQQAPHPAKPLDLTLQSFENGEIQAAWRGDGPPASKYFIERSLNGGGFQQISAVDAGEPSYRDLPSGDVEWLVYRVRAYNVWGLSDYSDTAFLWRGESAVKSPSKLQSSATSMSAVLLSWRNPEPAPLEIVIEGKRSVAEDFAEIARIPNASSFVASQLEEATTYWFRVKAAGTAGDSGYSNTTIATTLATSEPDPIPEAEFHVFPKVATLGAGQTQLFTANITWNTTMDVTWEISPAVGSITTGGLYTTPASLSSEELVIVTARSVADSADVESAVVSLVPVPQTYMLSGNISGTTQAVVTLSGPASASTVTSSSGDYSFPGLSNGVYFAFPTKSGFTFSPVATPVTVNSSSVPGIDFMATANPPSPRAVTLRWSASASPNVAGYNVYRSLTDSGPYSKINPSPILVTSFVDMEIAQGETYYYVATAVDDFGMESSYSNQATARVN